MRYEGLARIMPGERVKLGARRGIMAVVSWW
jgi:hypothetical protein